MGIGTATVVFADDGLVGLNRLKRLVADHALAAGGPHPTIVQSWVAEACRAGRDDEDEAVAEFLDTIELPVRRWRVAVPIPELRLPDHLRDTLSVAGCDVLPDLPPDLEVDNFLEGFAADHEREELSGPVIVAEVEAREHRSAQAAAIDRVEAARAILSAASSGDHRGAPASVALCESGAWAFGGSLVFVTPWLRLPKDSVRQWADGWHEFSEAAANPQSLNEWQERCLSAARWLHRSRSSWWTAERIAASFFALEAMLLPGDFGRGKGRELAKRVTDRWRLRDRGEDEQTKWLKELYGRERTSAVHTGRRVDRDLDADTLEEIAHEALTWGIWHLSPSHRAPNSPCETLDHVFDQESH